LDHHLPIVDRDVVLIQLGLVSHPLEELGLFGRVLGVNGRLLGQVRLHLLDRLEQLALRVGHDHLGGKVDDLRSDGEVDDLLGESVGINLPALGRHGLPVGGESLRCELEHIEVGHEKLSKGHVDEGGQEDAEI
jgi:hypothetical protein